MLLGDAGGADGMVLRSVWGRWNDVLRRQVGARLGWVGWGGGLLGRMWDVCEVGVVWCGAWCCPYYTPGTNTYAGRLYVVDGSVQYPVLWMQVLLHQRLLKVKNANWDILNLVMRLMARRYRWRY